jgi:hypothetical protein
MVNSDEQFAMIFGHCVWMPPSPKAALVALSLFFGIGINSEPDIAAGEAILASQYVCRQNTNRCTEKVCFVQRLLRACEVPPGNRNQPGPAN